MSYTALYRKFRPAAFEDVKGQDSIVTTLQNQLRLGRIGHAYLFCGTRGTGKTSVAKLFAKAVNCEDPQDTDPCGKCRSCVSIASGSSTNVIEIDAASNNSVDDIRNIREEVAYRPTEGKYKVYIIDEAHMLSTGAFNALLKTLEEPPEYVIFILATTEAAKLPVTIVSRCQRYDFKRITMDQIAARMTELLEAEHIEAEEKGIRYISRLADGSMRDALSLLERCISCIDSGILTYDDVLNVLGTVDSDGFAKMLSALLDNDIHGAIKTLEEYSLAGKDMSSFASDFTWYLRNLLLAKCSDGMEEMLDVSTEEYEKLREKAQSVQEDTLMRYIRVFSELCGSLKKSSAKRVEVEMTLIRLCRPQMDTDTTSLNLRIKELEKRIDEMKTELPRIAAESKAVSCNTVEDRRAEPVKKQVPQKAPKKQLVLLKDKWDEVIQDMPQPLKSNLEGSEVYYDASVENGKLFIMVKSSMDKSFLEDGKHPERKDIISERIFAAAGGSVDYSIISRKDEIEGIAAVPKKEEWMSMFNMKIDEV